jgi:hypothetical protein
MTSSRLPRSQAYCRVKSVRRPEYGGLARKLWSRLTRGRPIAVQMSCYLYVNNSQRIVRPYADEFRVNQTLKDSFGDLETFVIPGLADETAAIGWILHHGYYGALPEGLNTRGLRARVQNIQVGSENILQGSFPEPRFNAWTVGEVHVLHSPNLVPNGRRDDFEQNNHYLSLLNQLLPIGRRIAKICRTKSSERNHALRARITAGTHSNLPPEILSAVDTSPLASLHPIKKQAYLEVFEILSKIPRLPILREILLN